MTTDDLREAARAVVARRPGPITDPAILAKVATLVAQPEPTTKPEPSKAAS